MGPESFFPNSTRFNIYKLSTTTVMQRILEVKKKRKFGNMLRNSLEMRVSLHGELETR